MTKSPSQAVWKAWPRMLTAAAFYSLAEACQDTFLGLMAAKAVQSGETVKTGRQSWA